MICHFCDKPMKGGGYYIEHIYCESQWSCDACEYTEEYAYGSTRVIIKDKEFIWSYHDTDDNAKTKRECDEFMKQIKEGLHEKKETS